MKRVFAAVIVSLLAYNPASAEEVLIVEGDIAVGNIGNSYYGITEVAESCGAGDGSLQGIDGIAFTVTSEARGKMASMVADEGSVPREYGSGPFLRVDADVYWYDAACGLLDNYDMATFQNNPEVGTIPSDAAFGLIALAGGVQVHVTLNYSA